MAAAKGTRLSGSLDSSFLTQQGHREARAGSRVVPRSYRGRALSAILAGCCVVVFGILLTACASFSGADAATAPNAAGPREAGGAPLAEFAESAEFVDGMVFVGSAPRVPGSHAKLVLERNFRESRKLRWRSDDARIGGTEVDFFTPRDWKLEGDPPTTLLFIDRSPGPVLFGEIGLAPGSRAKVTVVLGKDRVTYWLERSDGDGPR